MITTGKIQMIDNIENYDQVTLVIDLSKIKHEIKNDGNKIIISLTKRESEKALF